MNFELCIVNRSTPDSDEEVCGIAAAVREQIRVVKNIHECAVRDVIFCSTSDKLPGNRITRPADHRRRVAGIVRRWHSRRAGRARFH